MGIKRKRYLDIDVVQAAQQRIINIFSNGVKVYLSCSGGKDSICLMDLTYKLIQEGKINPQQLEAIFVDEESMYDDVIEIVKIWRKRFLMVGAKFTWFCMEYRQMNCLHSLEEEETFVCWDRFQRENWCRPMPSFAVTSHPLLKPREEVYQKFLKRLQQDGITMTGVRVSESIQRKTALAKSMTNSKNKVGNTMYPIYDWQDSDVWLYIKNNGLEYPKAYEQMYACGVSTRSLRISNFFGLDSCAVLSKLYEYRPELAEAVLRREPNAYLVQMYWDSEMFKRTTKRRKKLEEGEQKDYKALSLAILSDFEKKVTNEHKLKVLRRYRAMVLKHCGHIEDSTWKRIHGALVVGDPKFRTLRAIETQIGVDRYARK